MKYKLDADIGIKRFTMLKGTLRSSNKLQQKRLKQLVRNNRNVQDFKNVYSQNFIE